MQDECVYPRPVHGALRSRVVAKLAGLTLRQVHYWHTTGIIRARVIPGARGCPRLYSWTDYMKLRAATKLRRQGVTTHSIRTAVAWLDQNAPDWHLVPVYGFSGRVLVQFEHAVVTADRAKQAVLPELGHVLVEIRDEGPLGELRQFSDCVDMHPDVLSGNPVMQGTRLETRFVAALVAHGVSAYAIATLYHRPLSQVERALEFDRLAA
ncbi:MAG: DUF433 domain-containing protein [Chloroflexi bacterium]|nr:DUF433 domain-containing protein [Chloroflexota bacterium]